MSEQDDTAAVWLVVPCYKESSRLPKFLPLLSERLAAAGLPVFIQVVDDGSPAPEPAVLAEFVAKQARSNPRIRPLLAYVPNRGKGYAIRAGWEVCPTEIPWLGFVDADGAVPAEEVERVIRQLLQSPLPRVVAAVREHQEGAIVKRHPVRHLGSRAFQQWVKLWHHLPIRDTQCGLKFFPADLYRRRAGQWRQSRYAFDLELLLEARRQSLAIEAVPVCWQEQAVSRLHLPAALRLFWHAWRCGR